MDPLRGLRSDHHKTSSIFSDSRAEGCNLGKTVSSGGLTQQRVYPQEYRTNVADNLACRSNRPVRIECEAKSINGPRFPGGVSETIPATIQASLLARLDRLGAAKHVAQNGAIDCRSLESRPTAEFDAVDGAHSSASTCHKVVALRQATLRGAVHGRGYHDRP